MTVLAHAVEAAGTFERARRGDHDAFAELVDRHSSMVWSIAYHVTGDRPAAEEIAQDVFLQLFRNLAQLETESHVLFWLRQVTTRRCIDQIRRSKWKLVSLESAATVVAREQQRDPWVEQRLLRNITALPEMQRAVVTLRYQEDLDPTEIASILDLPVNTVKSHLHRALRALRKKLETSS
jgi:RNA polymerase sigma-70 factor (ECF subfamily)